MKQNLISDDPWRYRCQDCGSNSNRNVQLLLHKNMLLESLSPIKKINFLFHYTQTWQIDPVARVGKIIVGRSKFSSSLGSGQTKGFCPLLDVFIPSIYWIFRATKNGNTLRIINQMFAKSLPLDARVKNSDRWLCCQLVWPVPKHAV